MLALLCLMTWSAVAAKQKDKVSGAARALTSRVVHIKTSGQVKFESNQPADNNSSSIQNVGAEASKTFAN
jgi:hypothetical protein